MNKSDALSILKSRKFVNTPDKVRVRCTNSHAYSKQLPNGQSQVAIANFAVMNPFQVEEAKELIRAGQFEEACKNTLSLSIRSNDYSPAKGDIVDVIIEEITLKKGKYAGQTALLITSCSEVKANTSLASVDFSEFEDDTDAPVAETASVEEEGEMG